MNGDVMAKDIVSKALELGYEQCGIIPVDEVEDYADRLSERIERMPQDRTKYSHFYRFAKLGEQYPWARSIVICVRRYGKYRIPPHLDGLIAKYYLVDSRRDMASQDYRDSIAFEEHMGQFGLRTETDRKFGITALRWAAYKAGLGIVRRNNFFYTGSGSWVYLEAWLVDREMELTAENRPNPCPPGCNRCISSCPTKSLREPYTMSRSSCVSCLTTWDGDDLVSSPYARAMGGWIYGCDICQDVCPFNQGKWENTFDFPGLDEISGILGLEQVVGMDYDTLAAQIQPKFWYVGADRVWKWKVNALNAIRNHYDEKYESCIAAACSDPNETVRRTAEWVTASVKRD